MSIECTHPDYDSFLPKWQQLRDCYAGESVIKGKRFQYLSPTSGMREDGLNPGEAGYEDYMAYIVRARFPDFVEEAVKGLIGVMHHKPPVFELPSKLEHLREKATPRGESLEMVLRRINVEQLILGRTGIIGEVDAVKRLPYLALYFGEHIINWAELEAADGNNLKLVVLDESGPVRDGAFGWTDRQQYRVLSIGLPEEDGEGDGIYRVGVFEDDNSYLPSELLAPTLMTKQANEIPFVMINSQDVVPTPDKPPLLALSDHALAVYRGEADYRQSLFLQGQDTLVTIGNSNKKEGDSIRTGTGARIDLRTGGDAKYIGVDSAGLPEQRTALENDYTRGKELKGNLIDDASRDTESGRALHIRVSAKTCTLNQVALAGGGGLEKLLKTLAVWQGANPDEVRVIPNQDFVDDKVTGGQLSEFMEARMLGFPLSRKSMHKIAQDGGATELTYDEELEAIAEETGTVLEEIDRDSRTTNPNGPVPADAGVAA